MTQQPPPQPPENEPQDAEPFWQEQTQTKPQYPSYPPTVAQVPATPIQGSAMYPTAPQSVRFGRVGALVLTAMIAAVLASAGTYLVTRNNFMASSVAAAQIAASAPTSPPPVVQVNPVAPNWSAVAGVVSPSVVAITVTGGQGGGQGSGVILDSQGHILTNNHVVTAGGSGSTLSVTLADERTYDATVVGTDASTDLAVIKLTNAPGDLKAIALGDSSTIRVGDQVMAVGNPLGLAGTVTTGIVSALNRPVTTSDQSTEPFSQQSSNPVVTNAIQTSAAINPGNSGGALVNTGGQLIGINSAIASLGSSTDSSSQSGNIGIGFAIPVNEARSIASQLISSGTATHPYLGVEAKDGTVTDASAQRTAAVLTKVISGTPADQAGLKTGDAVIALDGNPIDGSLSLVAQVHELSVGDTVTLTVVRKGRPLDFKVTLVAKPAGQ
jgi:putative serine protease PepD